ncbi:hypothetical protein GUITHDRAFT_166162 [Guillardia theta CCMP2712]|uniref:Uncharacterized protein n=2 Tax=Guillardia theta TaxID=55529 RepID=L1IEY9_GUITC|nr:hypothetical protein GUITHDRAFT_166162 [Guillardia theta CCMP2712]EKX34657.1 hypothetical protein GUITHDRAFT_166162 [Guillardia theta CCMP2712]|eukprot:XP_005821637.1 hypothetical protein GUITHDRAFT_166162 [Guillardia theta CCMP2712]
MAYGDLERRRTRVFAMAGGSFLIALACLNMMASFKSTRTTMLKSKMDPYVSSRAARSDLNSYFDKLPVHKGKRMGISARRARMQLNSIFQQDPSVMHQAKALNQRVRRQVVQDLAFSSKNAKDDIDSYFDSMQPETHKYSYHHHQHDKSDADEGLSHAQLQERLVKFKKQNPEFAKKVEEAHAMWMKNHKAPPKTMKEKKEYGVLLNKYVGDMAAILSGKEAPQPAKASKPAKASLKSQAFKAYMAQHPDTKKKFMKAQGIFLKKYGHLPQNDGEKQTFKALLKKYVGHLDISVKKTLGKDSADVKSGADDSTASKVDDETKQKMLKTMEKKDPTLQQKLKEAHDVWIKTGHKGPPKNAEEEKQYRKLLDQMVGEERTKAVKSM